MRRTAPTRAAALALLAACGVLAACGGPAASLFGVQRSGAIAGANLRLVPSGQGTVTCNSRSYELPDPLLLTAENLADDMTAPATDGVKLPSGPHPIYTYVVVTPDGTFSFSDDSPHITSMMRQLAAWVRQVSRTVCS